MVIHIKNANQGTINFNAEGDVNVKLGWKGITLLGHIGKNQRKCTIKDECI